MARRIGKTVFMPKKSFTKWIKALRSGKYEQARGKLKRAAGYCCLGVMQHCLTGKVQREGLPTDQWLRNNNIKFFDNRFFGGVGNTRTPLLRGDESAVSLNDSGVSFDRIATLLEKRYGGPVSKIKKGVK